MKGHPQFRFVLVSGQSEVNRLRESLHLVPRGSTYLLNSLRYLRVLMSKAQVFIGGYSGPAHIAAAMGTRVVSIFGPGDPARFAPRGHGRIEVIQKYPLPELSVAEVLAQLESVVKG